MTSATKYKISVSTVKKLFDAAGIPGAGGISALTQGEFNSAFSASAGGTEYVIKIAPARDAPILGYEKDMMKQELAAYRLLEEHGTVGIPRIYHEDLSGGIIPPAWFVMEKIGIPRLDTLKLAGEEEREARRKIAELAARFHRISGPGYGYPQCGLRESWYEALRGMVRNMVDDARRFGRASPDGLRLLGHIERFRNILAGIPPRLVNFDLWDPNIFYEKTGGEARLFLIDPERCFWGDPAADLVCLDFMRMDLEGKADVLAAYNGAAEIPLEPDRETKIRYYLMLAYFGLVMYTERFSRYRIWNRGYWRNTMAASMIAKKAFASLEALSRP